MSTEITADKEFFYVSMKIPRFQRGSYTYDEDREYCVDNVSVFLDDDIHQYGLYKATYLDYKNSLQSTTPIFFFDTKEEAVEFAKKYNLMIETMY